MIEIINDHQVKNGSVIEEYPAECGQLFYYDLDGINSIKIGEKEILFDEPIVDLLKIKDKWTVKTIGSQPIFGFDEDGNQLWQIEKLRYLYGPSEIEAELRYLYDPSADRYDETKDPDTAFVRMWVLSKEDLEEDHILDVVYDPKVKDFVNKEEVDFDLIPLDEHQNLIADAICRPFLVDIDPGKIQEIKRKQYYLKE